MAIVATSSPVVAAHLRHHAKVKHQAVTSMSTMSTMSTEESAPVDPYTATTGSSPYGLTKAEKRQANALAKQIVAAMTFDQKAAYVGTSQFGEIDQFKLPMLTSSEGTDGVSGTTGDATVFPSAAALAATWDPAMAAARGRELALDAVAGGVQMVNGPGLNMHRTPYGGREAEYVAGEDPILGAIMGTAYVEGEQSAGVMAELKHAFAYDQESNRADINETVDERTLHEIYELPFEAAVKLAEPAAIMCAFTAINGTHSCESTAHQVDLIQKQWGFKGFIQSDFGAIYDVGAALAAHTASDASGGYAYTASAIQSAISAGTATQADLDDGIKRIIRQLLYFKMGANIGSPDTLTEPERSESELVAQHNEEEALVLLKNKKKNLPFSSSVHSIAVLGAFANSPPPRPVGSGFAPLRNYVSEYEGIKAAAPAGTTVDLISENTLDAANSPTVDGWQASYFSTTAWQGYPVLQKKETAINFDWSTYPEPGCSSGECGSAVWTAKIKPTITGDYVFRAWGNGSVQVLINNERIIVTSSTPTTGSDGLDMPRASYAKMALKAGQTYDVTVTYNYESYWATFSGAPTGVQFAYAALSPPKSIKNYDAVVVSGGYGRYYEGEGIDKPFDLPEYQAELIENVAAANKHTTALIYANAASNLTDFNDAVASLVWAWEPGQRGGTAIANVLFGNVAPSGKMPFTLDRDISDNEAAANFPTPLNLDYVSGTYSLPYTEGMYFGYRGYDRTGATPLYAFGSGLSYTDFDYSNISLGTSYIHGVESVDVGFDVKNTGDVDGAEVAQVYVSEPKASVDMPTKQLKGFEREMIPAGETKHYVVHLPLRAFAHYDVDSDTWQMDAGKFVIRVGGASDKLKLKAPFRNPKAVTLSPKYSTPIFDPGYKN